MSDGPHGSFPSPAYADTVLAPLFETVKRYHWRHLLRIHRAHAVMLAECGLLAPADVAGILDALAAIETDLATRLGSIHYSGAHEDFFFFVEEDLRSRLGIRVAGQLHTGRSRNDIDQTMLKMALRERLLGLTESASALIQTLIERATQHRDTLVVAYTHGQPAQPTTWGHYLAAMIEVLLRDSDRLLHAIATVDQSSMGAAAITTTGFPIDRRRVADLLGFARVQENSYGSIAACDYVTEAYAALKVMAINIGRFVQDLGHWTAFEVGHLRVPDAFVQRSSIMPQKRNPVPIEHLRLLSSLIGGQCDAVLLAMHNTPFTDVNDNEYAVHETGYVAIETMQRVLRLLEAFVGGLEVDEAAVRRDIEASCITITELADSIVREEHVSFAEAHDICSRLCREMTRDGTTLATVEHATFASVFRQVVGRDPTLDDATVRRVSTPEHFIAVRVREGGPAPGPLDRSLAGYSRQLISVRRAAGEYQTRIETAARALAGREKGEGRKGERRRSGGDGL